MRGSASWLLEGPGGPSQILERLLHQLRNTFACMCARVRQLETRRPKGLLLSRRSVWLRGVTGGVLCACVFVYVCVHMQVDLFSRNSSVTVSLSAKMPATGEKEDTGTD